jgi:methionyl-tRNA formyltransferase
LIIWNLTNFLSSGPFKRYKKLIYPISQNRINIIDFSDESFIENYFNKKNIDVLVVSMWALLSKKIISAPKYGSINIHPSPLPRYRGSLPTLWALKNKDASSAVTYIVLSEAVDSGDILYQEEFEIDEQDNWLSIENKIQSIVSKSFVGKIKDYIKGNIELLKQNTSLSSKTARYEEYKAIDLKNEMGEDIFNKVNLYHYLDHWSVCHVNISENKKIRLKRINLETKQNQFNLVPGEIRVATLKLLLGSKDGMLKSVLFKDIPWSDSLALMFFTRHKIL